MLEVQCGYEPLPCFPRASGCLQFHNFPLLLVVIFQLLGLHFEIPYEIYHHDSTFRTQDNNNAIASHHKLKNRGFFVVVQKQV